jgi:hypothetical protein
VAVGQRTPSQRPAGRFGRYVYDHPDASRWIELVLLGGLILILGAMLVYGSSRVISGDVTHCSEKKFATVWPTGVELAVVSVIGFVVGRLVGYLKKSRYGGPLVLSRKPSPDPFVGVGLACFLVLATLLLGYETFAVFHPSGDPPPITSYVRCAAADNPRVSELAAFVIGLLLGNWIWYPSKKHPWRPWKP